MRHSHGLAVRLADVDPDRLRRNLPAPLRLWEHQVPAAPDSELALRRRTAELTRALNSTTGLFVRVVLLSYSRSTEADLIITAHRAALDYSSLRRLAAQLQSSSGVSGVPAAMLDVSAHSNVAQGALSSGRATADAAKRAERAEAEPAPSWGLGGARPGRGIGDRWSTLPQGEHDQAVLLAALALTGSRYGGATTARLGLIAEGGTTVIDLDVDEDTAVDAFVRSARERTRQCLRNAMEPGTERARPAVGLVVDADPGYHPGLPFELTVRVCGSRVECRFARARFDERVVEQFGRHFGHVARQLRAATSGTLVRTVELFDEQERDRISTIGSGRPLRAKLPARMADVFEAVAARSPDQPAVTCGEQTLTYRELDQRANRFANALRRFGVGREDRVGLCLERSVDLVAAQLAVLKAGAVYVPMDPTQPTARLRYTAADAGLRLTVGGPDSAQDSGLDGGLDGVRTVGLDELDGPPDRPHLDGQPADPTGYVIYTSGSTGRPKGVVVPQRNVLALIAATSDDLGLNGADVWTAFHSPAFDFSVWEIWGCLLTGGHLVVVPHLIARSPEEFHRLLVEHRVTVLNQTPTAFGQLLSVETTAGTGVLSTRLVIFGGEPLDPRVLLPWFDRYPDAHCRVVNMYGITETTVHSTALTVTRGHALAGSRSVGAPLPGWSVQVRDARGRLLPPLVAGEIWVGGAGVARGYLDRPELTAQRFQSDQRTGAVRYRSGDAGRLLPDGSLEHLGRLDDQVKVRGYRIELDEVRAVLLEDPDVASAAVVCRQGADGDAASTRLDAYVVLTNGGHPDAVRRRAAVVLPEYMLPATVTQLPALPLTANGKLDRARLPEPSFTAPTANSDGTAGDPLSVVLDVYERLLGRPVTADDNFFDLGGNSLLAIRLTRDLRDAGLPALPLREVYRLPTPRQLAAQLTGR
jgi:amino acid adenylation domain-containing protein